jgi:flagellar protein FliO/FliZ
MKKTFLLSICSLLSAATLYAAEPAKKEMPQAPQSLDTEVKDIDAQIVDEAANVEAASTEQATVAVTKNLPESQIPVLKEKKTEKPEIKSSMNKMIVSTIIIALLGLGSVLALRRWTKTPGKTKANQKIKVLTQHYLGPKKSLAIIQVAGESILIGITDHNISMLRSLSLLDEEVPEFTETNFKKAISRFDDEEQNEVDENDREEFAMRGLKDAVRSRMKGMRSME